MGSPLEERERYGEIAVLIPAVVRRGWFPFGGNVPGWSV